MLEFNEILSTLKRSYTPTLIVEGKDDYVAFREFENDNVEWGLTIFPVRGRENVIRLLELSTEISHPAIAFLVDQDCDIYSGLPNVLLQKSVITTDGYSIENDLLRDGEIIRFLRANERRSFEAELAQVSRFFACAAACHISREEGLPLSTHPNKILDNDGSINSEILSWMNNREAHVPEMCKSAIINPMRYLKGKTLLALFNRQLSRPSRGSAYSSANLLEIGALARGIYITRIEESVLSFFQSIGVAPHRN